MLSVNALNSRKELTLSIPKHSVVTVGFVWSSVAGLASDYKGILSLLFQNSTVRVVWLEQFCLATEPKEQNGTRAGMRKHKEEKICEMH